MSSRHRFFQTRLNDQPLRGPDCVFQNDDTETVRAPVGEFAGCDTKDSIQALFCPLNMLRELWIDTGAP